MKLASAVPSATKSRSSHLMLHTWSISIYCIYIKIQPSSEVKKNHDIQTKGAQSPTQSSASFHVYTCNFMYIKLSICQLYFAKDFIFKP